MALRSRYLNVICAFMAGLLLMATSFLYSFYVLELNWTPALLANNVEQENQLLIPIHLIGEKTISYPWVGDATCQHHPVQVMP